MKILGIATVVAAALILGLGGGVAPGTAQAGLPVTHDSYTCTGGSIPAGSYRSLSVQGACAVDAGSVTVRQDVTVGAGGTLAAAFGGSDFNVGRDLFVTGGGSILLGCAPGGACLNDPDQETGTLSTRPVIGRNLIAIGALAITVRNTEIGRNLIVIGGGGGVTCAPQGPDGPAFGAIEDSTIGGSATILGWRSCWLGFIRNTVAHDVNFLSNVTADPDGNEIVTNVISGRLNCLGNAPAPQIGDSEGQLNTASGASGQCASLITR